jgi:hypothetical protein
MPNKKNNEQEQDQNIIAPQVDKDGKDIGEDDESRESVSSGPRGGKADDRDGDDADDVVDIDVLDEEAIEDDDIDVESGRNQPNS